MFENVQQTDVSEEHKEFHVTDGTVLTFKSAADAGSEISAHANDGSVVVAQAIAANTDLIPNIYEGWYAFFSLLELYTYSLEKMICIVYRKAFVDRG